MSVYAKRVEGVNISTLAVVESPYMFKSRDTLFGHPKGLFILFFAEMWERFSYYGMRALLILYMTQALHYSMQRAGSIYGMYTGFVFVTPLIGGYLADRYMGQRTAILVGGVLIALGHFTLIFEPTVAFYSALGLLIIGNGFFKPNISVIVGQLYGKDDPRRDGAFSIFYMGINVGGFLSPLVCGALGQRVGWHWGFGAAGVGMIVGLLVYLWGQRYLGEHGKSPTGSTQSLKERPKVRLTAVDWQRIAVLVVLGIFGNVIFWAAFEQAGASMTLFADRATNLHFDVLNWDMPSSWLQSANPLFIIMLAPAFAWVWVRLAKSQREPSTPAKFVLGLTLVSLGFVTMMMGGRYYDQSGPVSMGWLLLAYFLNTCGELCLSPVGLSTVTKLAPSGLTSVLMGVWFLSMSLGNWLGGELSGEYDSMTKAAFFSIPAATAGVAAVLLLLLVRPLRKMMRGVH